MKRRGIDKAVWRFRYAFVWRRVVIFWLLWGLLWWVPAPARAAVGLDIFTSVQVGVGSTNATTPSFTIGANSDRVLVALIGTSDITNGVVTSVSGSGASWQGSAFGATTGGAGVRIEVWFGTAPTTGSGKTVTANFTAALATGTDAGLIVFSLYNAHQTTPLSGYVTRETTGNLVVTVASGDMALCWLVDTAAVRTISGCTTTVDTTDSALLVVYESAHCTGSPTSTFIWSAINGITGGVNVQQVVGGPSTAIVGIMAHPFNRETGRQVAQSGGGLY